MARDKGMMTVHVNVANHFLFLLICKHYGVSISSVVDNFINEFNAARYTEVMDDPLVQEAATKIHPGRDLRKFAIELYKLKLKILKKLKRRRGTYLKNNTWVRGPMSEFIKNKEDVEMIVFEKEDEQ